MRTETQLHEARSTIRFLRGEETRRLLMLVALRLIAEKAGEQVSVREILDLANQKTPQLCITTLAA